MKTSCLIVGSGPAGLMAADLLSQQGVKTVLCERRPAPGWKLLVAGSSGLNVSYSGPETALSHYYSHRQKEMNACLETFSRSQWLQHLEELGEETFLGTSRRYFLKNKKASGLLQKWMARLAARGVQCIFGEEFQDFSLLPNGVRTQFLSGKEIESHSLLLALGGGSWENSPPLWPEVLRKKHIQVEPFSPANAGFHLKASPEFFAKAQGKPIKGLTLRTQKGEKTGECMITHYGLEGTPVYTMGCTGPATLDLKPDLALEKLIPRIQSGKLAAAKLSLGAELLFQELAPKQAWENATSLAQTLKALPIELLESRTLSESISSRGGVSWDELDKNLELKKCKGVFCAGEMVDWDAPTGGFLLQASVSMGAVAAQGMIKRQYDSPPPL